MDGRFGGVGRGDGCEQKEIGFILFSFFVLKNVGSTALGRSFLFFSTQMGLVSSGLGFFFFKKISSGFWNNDYLFYLFFCDMIQLGPQLINLGWR